MFLFSVILALFLSFFATFTMTIVALSTAIGPWIEVTSVLVGLALVKIILFALAEKTQIKIVIFATAASGIAGSIAVATSFSVPMIYFLDNGLWHELLQNPVWSCAILGIFIIAAGLFGFLLASLFQRELIANTTFSFPVAQMVFGLVSSGKKIQKLCFFAIGVCSSACYGLILSTPLSVFPLFYAIGFLAEEIVAKPLCAALILKLVVINPIHSLFFSYLPYTIFISSFSAGIALFTAAQFVVSFTATRFFDLYNYCLVLKNYCARLSEPFHVGLLCISLFVFFLLRIPVAVQVTMILITLSFSYSLLIMAAKLGIAPIGRMATLCLLLVIPMTSNFLYLTGAVLFVEIALIVAADCLFARKIAQHVNYDQNVISWYQFLGLFVAALSLGFILILLHANLSFGISYLSATRAFHKALLINKFAFNYACALFGFITAAFLYFININIIVAFGGFLMATDLLLFFILGSGCARVMVNKEKYIPLNSGIYVGTTIALLLRLLFS